MGQVESDTNTIRVSRPNNVELFAVNEDKQLQASDREQANGLNDGWRDDSSDWPRAHTDPNTVSSANSTINLNVHNPRHELQGEPNNCSIIKLAGCERQRRLARAEQCAACTRPVAAVDTLDGRRFARLDEFATNLCSAPPTSARRAPDSRQVLLCASSAIAIANKAVSESESEYRNKNDNNQMQCSATIVKGHRHLKWRRRHLIRKPNEISNKCAGDELSDQSDKMRRLHCARHTNESPFQQDTLPLPLPPPDEQIKSAVSLSQQPIGARCLNSNSSHNSKQSCDEQATNSCELASAANEFVARTTPITITTTTTTQQQVADDALLASQLARVVSQQQSEKSEQQLMICANNCEKINELDAKSLEQELPSVDCEETKRREDAPTRGSLPRPTDKLRGVSTRPPNIVLWSELVRKHAHKQTGGTMLSQVDEECDTACHQSSSHFRPNELRQQVLTSGAQRARDRLKGSCFCHVFCALLRALFPIIGSLKDYSLPGDLATDFAAGFTVAVLQIPQSMAYGLLSGVDPIYGLYVSFVPVFVMSLMSKARHVSYGTFAITAMLLVSTVDQVKSALTSELMAAAGSTNQSAAATLFAGDPLSLRPVALPLVVTNNHRPPTAQGESSTQPDSVAASGVYSRLAADGDETLPLLAASLPSNIEILSCVCIVCGVIHITMSLMRLGILSLMFSDQLVSSFTTASAIHVVTSQLAGLFDLSLPTIHDEFLKVVRVWHDFGRTLITDGCNQTTAALSLASILFLLFIKELIEPRLRRRFARLTCLPSELALMALMIIFSSQFEFNEKYQVKIIGQVPSGLPQARAPQLKLVPYVLKDSLTIAIITFTMNLSIAQTYAKKFRYELDANQELFALGTANIVGAFFTCFPCASSLSRSSVQSNLNVRSQLCSLFSCVLVMLIVCFFAHILHDLPRSTLSCIIVVALKGILMQVRDLPANWRLSKLDAIVWVFTFVSVIVFGVTLGLVLGIVSSMFMIFLRLLTPNHSILGQVPGTDIFLDVDTFADCEQLAGVKIFRFNSALCYLNRTMLKSKIVKLVPSLASERGGFASICATLHARYGATGQLASDDSCQVKFIVVDCSALSYCDYAGATTLVELVEDLQQVKVCVYLAACPMKLIRMFERLNTQSAAQILSSNVCPTISDAIKLIRYFKSTESSVNMTTTAAPAESASCKKDASLVIRSLECATGKNEKALLDLP